MTAKLTMLLDMSKKLFDNKFTKLQEKFSKGTSKMKMKFKAVTKEVPLLGKAFDLLTNPIALVVAGILSIGTVAAKGSVAAEKFNTAFLPIKQLNLDKPKSEINQYQKDIRDAAFDVGIGIEASTNAMYDLQSATGLYGKDAISIYKKVGVFSKATGADINESMNATTKSMKAFGLGVEQIDSLLESNAKTVQVGITTFDELARVQTEYAGSVSAAGQQVDVGNKIFAMFTSISKNADIAANQTKTFFDSLGAQSAKIKEHLNIDVFDTKGNMKEADKLLVEISKKFQNLSDQQITNVINKIGGAEGLRTALNKVKTGAEDMINTFNAFDSSAFSLEEAVKNAEGDFGKMKQVFFNRLEIVFTKLGERVIPLLAGIFDMLMPALEFVYNNFDELATIITTVVTVATGLTLFFKIYKAFQLAAAATKGLTISQWLLNAAMNANPVAIMITGITLLITLVVMAIKKFDSWGSTILLILGPIGRVISAIILLRRHWDSIANAFSSDGIIAGLKRIGVVILDVLMHPVQKILGWIAKLTGWDWAKKAKEGVENFRTKMELITPEEKEGSKIREISKETDLYKKTEKSLLGDNNKGGTTKSLNKDITKVTGAAKQSRNISITIDSMHKGDIIMNAKETQGMTLQQVEDFFNEMLMRVVRNAETS